MNIDIDPKFVREIRVEFNDNEPKYTLYVSDGMRNVYEVPSGLTLPITRAQMLNIIDDVTEAKRNV